jgi:spermidine synthase
MRQRSLIYIGTLLTGMTGLVYQVVWQKYLTFVVGSETRSVALVVAVFLAGLAAGYRYWGAFSERLKDRRRLLRVYGLVELGIGVYAGLFPFYIQLIRSLSHHAPPWLLTDIVIALVTILAPTFLMGATIPLLVSVVPEKSDEVHLCHARIYGVNTLGACLGAFGSSFVLIPRFGLPGTLWLACLTNIVVGTVFVLNRLDGSITEKEPIEPIRNRFPVRSLYVYTLITGTITLSLEVLIIRLLDLAIGPGPHNFAIVVGVFVFGLALGSLLITERMLSVKLLLRAAVFLTVYLALLYFTVPYWPYWLNNVRVLLVSIPINYFVYMASTTGFLLLILLPFLIPLGFMLPLVYGLIPKDTEDYGKQCGRLYFFNTLGTATGAIVLAHLLLYFVDMDTVFKINVALVAALAAYLLRCEKRFKTATVMVLIGAGLLVGPGWNRASHYQGLYRYPELNNFNFTGIFRTPNVAPSGILYFNDGPDATVTVTEYALGSGPGIPTPLVDQGLSRALIINGKGDGTTVEDYSTITLAALLPYFHAPDRGGLNAAVIGLGTGITGAVLAGGEDVARVTVAEISSSLVEAEPNFAPDNYELSKNPKVEILALDGFKYFTRRRTDLDIVVSATSPPWVTGVENLFTPEFYHLAHDAMKDDGVFLQWFPLYTMDATLFRTIVANLGDAFPHLQLYIIGRTEMAILAGNQPFSRDALERRFSEPFIREVTGKMQLDAIDLLALIKIFDTPALRLLADDSETLTHTMSRPGLSYAADRVRFYRRSLNWGDFIDPRLRRMTSYSEAKQQAFQRLIASYPNGRACPQPHGQGLFCDQFNSLMQNYRTFNTRTGELSVTAIVRAYEALREAGIQPPDPEFLSQSTGVVLRAYPPGAPATREVIDLIVLAYVKDGLWDEALSDVDRFAQGRLIDQAVRDKLISDISGGRGAYSVFASRLRSR